MPRGTPPESALRALRVRNSLPLVLALVAIYWFGIHPWMQDWGSTPDEQQLALPGDELILGSSDKSTLAVSIVAPPEVVWQWLVQIGQDRGGYYTYTWLENIFGADIHNADAINPDWQALEVGDVWRLVPPDYLGGVGKDAVSPVLAVQPNQSLVVEMFGSHVIVPMDAETSRLLVRGASGPPTVVKKLVIDPLVFTMERRMLLGLKARAEGRPDAPPALMAAARLGWVAAGIAVLALFLIERERRVWLVAPLLASLPAVLMAADPHAALAALLAVGIITLGFLIYGRRWIGPLLVIASAVMLTLLLAPEAYVAIGLALLAILVAWSARRLMTSRAAAGIMAPCPRSVAPPSGSAGARGGGSACSRSFPCWDNSRGALARTTGSRSAIAPSWPPRVHTPWYRWTSLWTSSPSSVAWMTSWSWPAG